MPELALGVGLVALVICGAWWTARISRQAERGRQAEGSLDAVDEARTVERDVSRESDPVGRLRDRWRRPVPGKSADSDQ